VQVTVARQTSARKKSDVSVHCAAVNPDSSAASNARLDASDMVNPLDMNSWVAAGAAAAAGPAADNASRPAASPAEAQAQIFRKGISSSVIACVDGARRTHIHPPA
jgi:hypothetical protein